MQDNKNSTHANEVYFTNRCALRKQTRQCYEGKLKPGWKMISTHLSSLTDFGASHFKQSTH